MKLKIVSDGTAQGTKIVNDMGKEISGVERIKLYEITPGVVLKAEITILEPHLEIQLKDPTLLGREIAE